MQFPDIITVAMLTGTMCIARFLVLEVIHCIKDMRISRGTITFTEILRSHLDYYFSVNTLAKPILLMGSIFSVVLMATIALMLVLDCDLPSAAWRSWTYVADSGVQGSAYGMYDRMIAFTTSVGGMMLFAVVIGVVSDSIGQYLDNFKKGRAKVIESGHGLILNWNGKALSVIQQLALANESEGGIRLVVLSEDDAEKLTEKLRVAIHQNDGGLNLLQSQVMFRNGSPLAMQELVSMFSDLGHPGSHRPTLLACLTQQVKVSAATAKFIIVLSPDNLEPDIADSRMVRQVLALREIKKLFGGLRGHIAVELQDIDNKASVLVAGKGDVEVIVSHDLIGRMMLLAARSPWFTSVLDELIGFSGSEIYMKEWNELLNEEFGSVLYRFDEGVPIGVKRKKDGEILINPPEDYRLARGDLLLVIAEDDDSYTVNKKALFSARKESPEDLQNQILSELNMNPVRMLFCGWRRDMADMISQLDEDVAPGSEIWLFNTVPVAQRGNKLLDNGNKVSLNLKNLQLKHVVGNPSVGPNLTSLAEVSDGGSHYSVPVGVRTGVRVGLDHFTSILILSEDGEALMHPENADGRTMAMALKMRDIQRSLRRRLALLGQPRDLAPPVCEVLDVRTRMLMRLTPAAAGRTPCEGCLLTNYLLAAVIAAVAENRDLNGVYEELWSCRTSHIRVRSMEEVCRGARDGNASAEKPEKVIGAERSLPTNTFAMTFWELTLLAQKRGEIAIGYIQLRLRGSGNGSLGPSKVVLNPTDKSRRKLWDPQDQLVVIGLSHRAAVAAKHKEARAIFASEFCQRLSKMTIPELSPLSRQHPGNLKENIICKGWLRRLKPGKETDMQDERNWLHRLVVVVDGQLIEASEPIKGERRMAQSPITHLCNFSDISDVRSSYGWPPGWHTFYVLLQDLAAHKFSRTWANSTDYDDTADVMYKCEQSPAIVFSAETAHDCDVWVAALRRKQRDTASAESRTEILQKSHVGKGEKEWQLHVSTTPSRTLKGNLGGRWGTETVDAGEIQVQWGVSSAKANFVSRPFPSQNWSSKDAVSEDFTGIRGNGTPPPRLPTPPSSPRLPSVAHDRRLQGSHWPNRDCEDLMSVESAQGTIAAADEWAKRTAALKAQLEEAQERYHHSVAHMKSRLSGQDLVRGDDRLSIWNG